MSARSVQGDVALSGQRGLGTHLSAPLANGPGVADVVVFVHVTAVSGTSPTLAVAVEQSADGTTWTAVPGATIPTLSAVGGGTCNAAITGNFARVTATVGGTATPTVTFRAAVLVFAE